MSESPAVIHGLVDLFRDLHVNCIVQIGAGYDCEAMKIAEQIGCKAYCLEADPKVGPPPSQWFHHAFIGATDSIMPFYRQYDAGLSGGLPRSGMDQAIVQLEQSRLDTFCEANGIQPDALVIDTEGTTLDVLEGCGILLDGVKAIYAECQFGKLRPGVRDVSEVKMFLHSRGFVERLGKPAYLVETQGNFCWVKG